MSDKSNYISPFSTRYSSAEMQFLFSHDHKFKTWRRLWISLAKAEQKLGLAITDAQIAELEKFKDDINYDVAEAREKEVRHDVMSHVYAYGKQCPNAEAIIHLGATSCYVGDNTDVIILREASELVLKKCAQVLRNLAAFAEKYKAMPCLAYTHLQPAQLTTVGKRATLWINEFMMDLEDLEYIAGSLKLLGSKGTTGTQASFMELFDGDQETIKKIDGMIAKIDVYEWDTAFMTAVGLSAVNAPAWEFWEAYWDHRTTRESDYPELKRGAEEEIRIFRKHGYNSEALWIQEKLDRAEEMLAEMKSVA